MKGLFSVLATTRLRARKGCKTAGCFAGAHWAHCDPDFCRILPAQPQVAACVITTLALNRSATCAEWAAELVGVRKSTPITKLEELLIKKGNQLVLTQVEAMVDMTRAGINTGMRTDDDATFFFVKNVQHNISIGLVERDNREWSASIFLFGLDGPKWSAGSRLLVCNMDRTAVK